MKDGDFICNLGKSTFRHSFIRLI